MSYVIAGYTIVLSILFLYGLQLVWRRRRLTRTAARVAAVQRPDRAGRGRAVTTAPAGRPGAPPDRPPADRPDAARPAPAGADAAPATGSGTWSWVWCWSGRWSSWW